MGVEKIHPFDGKKFFRAWQDFTSKFELDDTSICKDVPAVDFETLLLVHEKSYLDSLQHSPDVIARVIEVALAKWLPVNILYKRLVKPFLHACQGTLIATEAALNGKLAMNFGGGFHHAFADHGEGFCFFADAALGIQYFRKNQKISQDDTVLMIDLDAHRGNGFESFFLDDDKIKIFDMYNAQNYPGMHPGDVDEYPFMVPMKWYTNGDSYLRILKDELMPFLDEFSCAKIAIYNAGSDILSGDRLGALKVDFDQVIERDVFVLQNLITRKIPTVVLTSGGYTKQSYKLVSALAQSIVELSGMNKSSVLS